MAENAENAPAGQADAFQGLANRNIDNPTISPAPSRNASQNSRPQAIREKTLRAFFSLELASGLIVRGCTLHTKNGKFWVGLPAKLYTIDTDAQSWAAIVDFRDKRTAARFQEMATAAAVEAFERMRGAA